MYIYQIFCCWQKLMEKHILSEDKHSPITAHMYSSQHTANPMSADTTYNSFPWVYLKGFGGGGFFFVLLFRIVAFTVFFSLVVFAAFNRLISFSFLIWFCLFLLTFFWLLLNILFFKSDKNGIVSNGSPVY